MCIRSRAVVCVLANDELRDQCHEFHFLGPQDLLELVCGLIVVR